MFGGLCFVRSSSASGCGSYPSATTSIRASVHSSSGETANGDIRRGVATKRLAESEIPVASQTGFRYGVILTCAFAIGALVTLSRTWLLKRCGLYPAMARQPAHISAVLPWGVCAITRDTKVRSKLHHGHQSADCERTCPRPIRTTLAPSAGVVQNLAHAAMSVRRFSNRSPRPGYFFA
jgi:hypothetical protein